MSRRSGILPRSSLPLAAILAAAVVWLILDGGSDRPAGGEGGLLFAVPADSVAAVDLRRGDVEMRLERTADGWSLAGTVADGVEADVADALVDALAGMRSGPAIGGPGDRAPAASDFGLDPAAAVLAVETADGRSMRLEIGDANPATGLIYAAGCGRDGVFGVSPALGERLARLPNSLRRISLWPEFHPLDVDTLALRVGDGPVDVFARDENGRWWLRAPRDGFGRIGEPAAGYHAEYADRRRDDAGGGWLRASDVKLANVMFYVAEANIYSFDPVVAGAEFPAATEVDVRASFSGGEPPQSFAIGRTVGEGKVEAWRNGSPHGFVILERLLLNAAAPLGDYVEDTVLSDPVGAADSLVFSRIDSQPIVVVRELDDWRLEGDYPWSGEGPEPADLARDMVMRLDRLEMVRALPRTDSDPLRTPYRTEVELAYSLPGFPERVGMVVGILQDEQVPCAWFPQTGKLVEVDRAIFSTLRSLFMALGRPDR